MILEGTITLTGVHRPIISEVYNPILRELKDNNIQFKERKLTL
jgi:hypothetical protein